MIKKFIEWWYTDSNGVEYMNFEHCSNGDMVLIIYTGVMATAVLFVYTLISRESYTKSRQFESNPSRKYLRDMINVFILCGVTGYGYTIMSIWVNPYKLRVLLLCILFYHSLKLYRSMRSSRAIERIMQAEVNLANDIARLTALELSLKKRFQADPDKKASLIKYNELNGLELGKEVEGDDGIVYSLTDSDEDELSFITTMKDGSEFGQHFHDCGETCHVLEGTLVSPLSGKRIEKGGNIYFPAGKIHAPYAEGEVKLLVIFKKPKS